MSTTVLTLTLFGSYRVTLYGQPLAHFKTAKVRALLTDLAIEIRPHERSSSRDCSHLVCWKRRSTQVDLNLCLSTPNDGDEAAQRLS